MLGMTTKVPQSGGMPSRGSSLGKTVRGTSLMTRKFTRPTASSLAGIKAAVGRRHQLDDQEVHEADGQLARRDQGGRGDRDDHPGGPGTDGGDEPREG